MVCYATGSQAPPCFSGRCGHRKNDKWPGTVSYVFPKSLRGCSTQVISSLCWLVLFIDTLIALCLTTSICTCFSCSHLRNARWLNHSPLPILTKERFLIRLQLKPLMINPQVSSLQALLGTVWLSLLTSIKPYILKGLKGVGWMHQFSSHWRHWHLRMLEFGFL